MKKFSIRTSLIINFTLVIVSLSSAILITTIIASRNTTKQLSSKIIHQTMEQAEEKLSGFFIPIAKELLRLESLGNNQFLSLSEPDRLREQFKSIMEFYPQLSALVLVDDKSNEFALFQLGETWTERHFSSDRIATIKKWDKIIH